MASNSTGRFQVGGDADIVIVNSQGCDDPALELSFLIDEGNAENIEAVFVSGGRSK